MIRALKRALSSDRDPAVVVECRRCGATLAADDAACPDCGADEVATYRIR